MSSYDVIGYDLISANTIVLNHTTVTTTTYNATVANYFIGVDSITAGGLVTINLPDPNTLSVGQVLIIKDEVGGVLTNGITIMRNSLELIDDAASYNFSNNYESVSIYWNGTNWMIF